MLTKATNKWCILIRAKNTESYIPPPKNLLLQPCE